MSKPKKKQISIQLPDHVIELARVQARLTRRPDGLKQTPTAMLREWLLKGMEIRDGIRQS